MTTQQSPTVTADKQTIPPTRNQKDRGMWEFTDPFWSAVFKWATISALVFGAVGIISAFVSAWIGYEITDATQKGADSQIKASQARSDEAKAEAAKANERAASLEKDAQEARLETEKIKERVAWRVLNAEQLQSLTSELAASHGSVTLAWIQNDPEAIYVTGVLSNAFSVANKYEAGSKWNVVGQPRMYSDRNIFGIHIFGKNPSVVAAIRHAFDFAKIEYFPNDVPDAITVVGAMTTSSGAPNTDAVVMVGSKLPTF